MPGITLEVAQAKLEGWLKAEDMVSRSQSYSHEGLTLTRADADQITAKIEYWNNWVQRLSGGRRRGVSRVVLPS
tara:strand:- start:1015 stop:1236 length:222 start_codon:yes stop_codon:yes gene_type:complete